MKLLATNSGTNQTSMSFTSGINSTYKLYMFKYFAVNAATNATAFTFNGSIDAGSNYNVTKTTSYFWATHLEDDSGSALEISAGDDLAQSTDYQMLADGLSNGADEDVAGTLWLFAPSSTTYQTHFFARSQWHEYGGYCIDGHMGGYFNSADNIDAISFKMASGNFDGTIKMYGVA